jgi:hypothetical protein
VKINDYLLYFYLLIWLIAELLIGKWIFKAQPKKDIIAKYPKKVIILSSLPFGTSWEKRVEKEDIKVFRTYQHRANIGVLSIVVSFFIFVLYIFVKF